MYMKDNANTVAYIRYNFHATYQNFNFGSSKTSAV